MMVERGVPLGTVQAFVGHMSTRMLTHYTHISSGAARKAVELLDQDPILTETSVKGLRDNQRVYSELVVGKFVGNLHLTQHPHSTSNAND